MVINADDQRTINMKGNIFIMLTIAMKFKELSLIYWNIKAYFGQFINCDL